VATLHAAHWLDAKLPDRRRCPVDVLDLERHVVQAGTAVAKEAVEIAALAGWLQQLEMPRAAGDAEPHAAETDLLVFEPSLDRHAHEISEQRQRVVDSLDGPADVVQPLDAHLFVIHSSVLARYQRR